MYGIVEAMASRVLHRPVVQSPLVWFRCNPTSPITLNWGSLGFPIRFLSISTILGSLELLLRLHTFTY